MSDTHSSHISSIYSSFSLFFLSLPRYPVEISNSWSSPTWVVRILNNEKIPYKFTYDLKIKPQRRASY